MIHRKSKRKFSRGSGHRIGLFRNLCKSLINHKHIKTTLPKAKSIQGIVEKLVTLGKENSLSSRRRLISKLGGSKSLNEVEKLVSQISPSFKNRQGGYTRVIKSGYRKGDCAPMAIIQFVESI